MSKVTEKYFDSKLDAPVPSRDQDADRNQYMHIAKWQSEYMHIHNDQTLPPAARISFSTNAKSWSMVLR